MPPWWVYKNHGERSDLRPARFCVSHPAKGSDCVGVVSDAFNHNYSAYFLRPSFYQVLVIVQRDGVELNSFAVSYISTNCLFILPESGA